MVLSSDEKYRYLALSSNQIQRILGWMNHAAVFKYRNDEGTVFNQEYYTFWQHYRFLKNLAEDRNLDVNDTNCSQSNKNLSFNEFICLYFYPSCPHPSLSKIPFSYKKIILDKPFVDYCLPIRNSCVEKIFFLCCADGLQSSHLLILLREERLKYEFLNIPVDEWKDWKGRPDYKGDDWGYDYYVKSTKKSKWR